MYRTGSLKVTPGCFKIVSEHIADFEMLNSAKKRAIKQWTNNQTDVNGLLLLLSGIDTVGVRLQVSPFQNENTAFQNEMVLNKTINSLKMIHLP